ncbi:MAG: penicillin acylase family protein [Saprospiraceae bacterium]|nr:penicillin acylase family protein [Saprospiraceae bacterium]
MQLLKFFAALTSTIVLILLFDWHHPFDSPLPAVGRFFNPGGGFWQNARVLDLPNAQQLQIAGLSGEVQVVFDERLVPHIFADNIEDAAFAQGYLTAMHRLWQLDISVRQVAGRLSEVLGERTLSLDRLQRHKGLVFAAQNALTAWERLPEEIAVINAYTEGINAYVKTLKPKDYPIEFKLLNYKPEEWTPLKSALFFKNMAETLCIGEDDLETTNARTILGEELFNFLYPEQNPKQSPIIPVGTPWNFEPLAIKRDTANAPTILSEVIRHESIPKPNRFNGSNNWAVSGSKTASGKPILCNDPHLNLTLPSIWYEIQIHTPQLNAYGVSLPGLPGIIIGFNENIAWGVTNVGQDVVDWYKITWMDDKKSRYLLDDETREVEVRLDTIKVRGKAEPVVENVKYTVWGPIVYESTESPYQDMAMRWIAHDTPEKGNFYDIGVFLRLMQGKNYDDYSTALTGYDSPPQNFVFASKDGDIALKVNGKFPLKEKGQGRFIQDGSFSRNAWNGFIPKNQVPQVRNPPRGFVSSANQRSTDNTYPYYYNGGFDDYRGRYLNRRLEQMSNITAEDMMALQLDNYSIKGEEGAAALLKLIDETKVSESNKKWLQEVKSWDYRYEKDSKAALIFERWFAEAYKLTFDEVYKISEKDSVNVLFPENWRFIELLTNETGHSIFDNKNTEAVETASAIVEEAFNAACNGIREEFGEDFSWSAYKATRIGHLARIDAFNSPILENGGVGDALNATKRGHGLRGG